MTTVTGIYKSITLVNTLVESDVAPSSLYLRMLVGISYQNCALTDALENDKLALASAFPVTTVKANRKSTSLEITSKDGNMTPYITVYAL